MALSIPLATAINKPLAMATAIGIDKYIYMPTDVLYIHNIYIGRGTAKCVAIYK